MMSSEIRHEISSADICERLVGITPVYLQNFIQRGSYGIRASVRPGEVRAQHRRFSRDDVFGIALVWLLFEGGLRGDPIARILRDITGAKKANANLAAKTLLERKAECLQILRQPRQPSKNAAEKPHQEVQIVDERDTETLRSRQGITVEVLVPVGHKFRNIAKRMEILFSE